MYQISNLGTVKSLKCNKEKILKATIEGHGYFQVTLYKNGIYKTMKVHQLVAIAFFNHKPNRYELVVNHINFNKLDNRVENLELVTARQNSNKKHLKSSSKYVGVCWRALNKKWKAEIYINGKSKHLGLFNNEYDAHLAYQKELKTINKKQ